ncbi:hypothetical protein VD0004_g5832 [Verticillium dahliae]|nr:hypothetical protein VD0004_g5832 [Verticillium dahliae]PNH66985.1 hypothetical protein VD0001_g7966 [Verticillium dahliae]
MSSLASGGREALKRKRETRSLTVPLKGKKNSRPNSR